MRTWILAIAWLPVLAHAVPPDRLTIVNRLEIPGRCEPSYDAAVRLFAQTVAKSLPERNRLWDARTHEEADPECQLAFSQALLDASAKLTREIALHYWLDAEQARHERLPPGFLEILKAETRAELRAFGLDSEVIEEGGDLALGSREHRALPAKIREWKQRAATTGRAQLQYRFLFTSGGAHDRGYSLYDFARGPDGKKRLDASGEPIRIEGSYGREVRQIVGFAKTVLRDYEAGRPTFLQRIFDVNESFYAGSLAWDRPEKLARELREEEYPRQMEAYLRMARAINLGADELSVFYDLYRALLVAQNESLAADDRALEKVEQFAVNVSELGVAVLTGGESLALLVPKLGVNGAHAAMLIGTVSLELLGSQALALWRGRQLERLHQRRLDWDTYLELSAEAGADFLPVATALPSLALGVSQLGELAFVSVPRLLAGGVGRLSMRSALASVSGLPKRLWLNWWESRAVLKAGPKVLLLYSGMQVMHGSVNGTDRQQTATSIVYATLGTLFSPTLVNEKKLGSRFVLNGAIAMVSSFLAQSLVKGKYDWERSRVDLGYSAAFSFWVFEGNRRTLKGFESAGLDAKRQELVWVSLQFLKSVNVDNHLKDLFLTLYGKKGMGAAAEAKAYLRDTYGLDFSPIPDADFDAGARMFVQYAGIPADQT